MLVDNAKGVGKEILDGIKRFIMQTGKMYNVSEGGTRMAIFSYGSSSKKLLSIDKGVSLLAIEDALARIKDSNEPRHAEMALDSVRDIVANRKDGIRNDVGKVAVLFIAGDIDSASKERMKSAMVDLNRAGVNIATVGLGSDINLEGIKQATAWPDQFVQVYTSGQLPEATAAVSELASDTQKLSGKIDIGFVIGASGSDASKDFATAKYLIKELIKRMYVASDAARIGLVRYGLNAQMILRLDTNLDERQALMAIDRLRLPQPGSDLSRALDMSTDYIFHEWYGARRGIPKTTVVFSNTKPDAKSVIASERLKGKGVRVLGIALGSKMDAEAMKDISSSGKDAFMNKRDVGRLINDVILRLFPGN